MKALREEAKRRGEEFGTKQGRGSHTKVWIGNDQTVVPGHKEINEITAREILKQMGVQR